ncbi:hypothetical protein BDY21DRAFT_85184 [Lineolata rhizophorae]|uniref:Myb-like domain-containing protein n=1 Tax=Lineolata rhizophorae TaxID=578093 RepID=A0A6A6PBT7_9PEZI|nr:hypothetical protein BDY21DRAFT_85184 [Lineolata rhizophorae]
MNTMPKEPRQSTTSYRTNPLGAPPSTATTTTSGSMSSASGTTATATAAAVAGTSSTAASNARASTTWSADDDEQLMRARAQGLNWQPIAARFFPGKTANACRKRHERLMERQKAENWDGVRLETLATEYARARRAMWTMLGERVGEKWTVVEQKVREPCDSLGYPLTRSPTHPLTHTRPRSKDPLLTERTRFSPAAFLLRSAWKRGSRLSCRSTAQCSGRSEVWLPRATTAASVAPTLRSN